MRMVWSPEALARRPDSDALVEEIEDDAGSEEDEGEMGSQASDHTVDECPRSVWKS